MHIPFLSFAILFFFVSLPSLVYIFSFVTVCRRISTMMHFISLTSSFEHFVCILCAPFRFWKHCSHVTLIRFFPFTLFNPHFYDELAFLYFSLYGISSWHSLIEFLLFFFRRRLPNATSGVYAPFCIRYFNHWPKSVLV